MLTLPKCTRPTLQRQVAAAGQRGVSAARRGGLQVCAGVDPRAEKALLGEVRAGVATLVVRLGHTCPGTGTWRLTDLRV